MPRNDQPATRRSPQQARAEQTVQVIFEAAAQVLREEGEAAFTTNRIAARAGVSIGTLYQYFDSKEAILAEVMTRARKRLLTQLDGLLSKTDTNVLDPLGVLRAYVRLYLTAYGTGSVDERVLLRMAWGLDRHDALVLALRETSEHIAMHLQRLEHPLVRKPTPAMVFVLTRALAGVVRAAALEASPLLGSRALEEELVNLCWGVLRTQDAPL
jgi:AcrR family transcriptional regulator